MDVPVVPVAADGWVVSGEADEGVELKACVVGGVEADGTDLIGSVNKENTTRQKHAKKS